MRYLIPHLISLLLAGCFAKSETPVIAPAKVPDEQQVADAALAAILSDPDLAPILGAYGTPGSNEICLLDSEETKWPRGKYASAAKYKIHFGRKVPKTAVHNRMLGLALGKFEITPGASPEERQAKLYVTIFNAGGAKNGAITTTCRAVIIADFVEGKWQAKVRRFKDD